MYMQMSVSPIVPIALSSIIEHLSPRHTHTRRFQYSLMHLNGYDSVSVSVHTGRRGCRAASIQVHQD